MKKYRIIALSLVLVFMLSMLPAGVFASGDVIELNTAKDIVDLAEKCRLDSWSVGKTVVLKKDIDLGGFDFSPIPSFGGTFEGGGHTISGLFVTGNSTATGGLFRYIQISGIVRELTVRGTVCPDNNAEYFGGIAGENSGRIINCTFYGSVSGRNNIGGVVGLNTATGELSGCRSLAAVVGEHYTGGIAGRNMGSITNCINLGAVNTTNPEMSGDELDIDWEKINSTENFNAHTDTGGITGFSDGIVEDCINRGNIGYPHVGYNVGGIVGRQSGFMDKCRNFGTVNGRKDVGGVVGQMVPAIELKFSTASLAGLEAEMQTMKALLDELITDFQGSANNLTGILSDAGGYLESAGESANAMSEALMGAMNEGIETLKPLVERYALRFGEIVSEAEGSITHLSLAVEHLRELAAALEESGFESEELYGYVSYTIEKLDEALALTSTALGILTELSGEILASLERGDELGEFIDVVRGSADDISSLLEQLSDISSILADGMENGFVPALEEIGEIIEASDELSAIMDKAEEEFALAVESLEKTAEELERWMRDLMAEDPEMPELDDSFMDEAERLDAAIIGLGGAMEQLNDSVRGSANLMAEDMKKINDQFFRVMESFMNMLEFGESDQTIYEDISEEELFAERDGKVQNCENRGAVEADTNVGGLVGTMAIEYDLDPEEDISVSGTVGGTFHYFTNAVLMTGLNVEEVKAKKDDVGGSVGYMDLGVVYGCENYGDISSTSGDYVGGIAGQSAAAVRNSWSLCRVSGRDYVGGVAGYVENISGCRAMVQIFSEGGWSGAIAGELAGEAKENYFVGEKLGGIDGVSYAGKAEPQAYRDFILSDNLPGEFTDFKLVFATDSILVKSVSFDYGDDLDLSEIPAVPERVGYVGAWEDYNFEHLTFSDVVHAVYTPYDTVVASAQEEGKRAVILLEGAFLPGSVPVLSELAAPLDGSVAAWTVDAVGSVEEDFRLRCLVPDDSEELEVFILRDGEWTFAESERDGSYIIFDGSGETVSFCVTAYEREIPVVALAAVFGVGLVLAIIVLIAGRRARKKR